MQLLTVREAADHLKVTRSAVYVAIARGKLTRHVLYGHVLLDAEEVRRYRPNAYGARPAGRRSGRPRRRHKE